MSYVKVWLGRQDAFPGYQDWNALVGNEEAFREAFVVGHGVNDDPPGPGQAASGEHDLHEVPRGTVLLVPTLSGTSVIATRRELAAGAVVGHSRLGTGVWVVYTRGLSSSAWADACAKARGDGLPRRVHVERFDAAGESVPAGASDQGFVLRLFEWSGSAWAAADFEVSVTVSSP